MGYYTRYKVTSLSEGINNEQVEELVLAVVEAKYGNPFEDECKWYDHDVHMKEVSRQSPDIIFKLHGEGEESGDVWYKYYKNGKVQKCNAIITFEDFDESKLI